MTITQETSAPLVAVVGATGNQGGSVIKALAESDKPYRIRAFTRDAAKPAAQALAKLGVDIVVVSFVVENKDEVYKAFVGADFAFLVTNFWEHLNVEKETEEGKLLVDAAKAGGVSRIVWSGLPSIIKTSAGKYTHVYHFEGKAVVTEYGRQSGVPFVDVQAGWYGTNFLNTPGMIMKHEDGSFVILWPIQPTTLVPFIDAVRDYGLFVRYALELPVFPDGSELVAHGENISITDLASQLSQGTGKNIVFKQITVDRYKQGLEAAGVPPHIILDMVDSYQAWDEYGWKATTSHEGLARRPRTWAEFIKVTDWSQVLA
ncbi:NAD(P)-binding protein [Mycena maculata]|uniref:NAD(P)-binding protein n=1 Tax=Mycena maculata TaxID=230809 RepID=A0AAD7P2R4_9AGAR|nr:NAD(P)-binding protein [Mycena maculata]